MNNIKLEEKYVLEYIRDILNQSRISPIEIENAKYHHNTSYDSVPLILKHGLLSISKLNELGIIKYTPERLKIMDDTESHINGIDHISLAVMGLDDLYINEEEYEPDSPSYVDFRISSDVKARRSSERYGNEFLAKDIITPDKFKALDIRLLNLTQIINKYVTTKNIIDEYNSLKSIALAIKENNLDIPLREMSKDNLTLDIDAIASKPKIILK